MNARDQKPKAGDSEKITINLGYVDLGNIDLLVQEGFYANRTDLIRTAIRNQIDRHGDALRQAVTRKSVDLGLRHYSREDLEAARNAGQTIHIRVLGLATIAGGELALDPAEASEHAWFPLAEPPQMAFPDQNRALAEVQALR